MCYRFNWFRMLRIKNMYIYIIKILRNINENTIKYVYNADIGYTNKYIIVFVYLI